MSKRKKKNAWAGILIGPALTGFALMALWKNETRFDYHRAAEKADIVASPEDAAAGQIISLTGSMDRGLTLQGEYVASFTGYLFVQRSAEIYAWERDEDSDGDVSWSRRWMNSVESNSRNSGLRQELRSNRFAPEGYQVGELPIEAEMIEFVDSRVTISLNELEVTHPKLKREDGDTHLYFRKGRSDELGDERVSFRAVPIPATATYFGKFQPDRAVADTTHQRTGMINSVIQDTGILHHIVAGDRETALATMKGHIARVKWIVRGIGTFVVVFGLIFAFSTLARFLFHLPYIGRIAEWGALVLALAIGIPLAGLTIISSYLIAHPLILVAILLVIGVAVFLLRWNAKRSQRAAREQLEQQFGYALDANEIEELEFKSLARLALSDSGFAPQEEAILKNWARKRGWDTARYETLVNRAKRDRDESGDSLSNDQHLMNLIQLAIADGAVSSYELKSIRKVARKVGYDDVTVRDFIQRARSAA